MKSDATAAALKVAMVGATSILGRELRRVLWDRRFPLQEITMMGDGEDAGKITEYGGEAHLVGELDPEKLAGTDILFICEQGQAARHAMTAAAAGDAFIIDLADAQAGAGDPVISMDINAHALPAHGAAHIRAPHQATQILSTVLGALGKGTAILEVRGTAITPVSDGGEPAVEELYRQTAGILSFGEKPERIFSRQVAFNAVPHALMNVQQGWPDLDARLRGELARILDLESGAVSMRALVGSVFHGISLLVSVRFERPPTLAVRRKRLSRAPFSFGPQTPADLGDSQSIHVSDLGDEGGGRVGLWIVADNLRGGCVANGVAIALALAARAGEGS